MQNTNGKLKTWGLAAQRKFPRFCQNSGYYLAKRAVCCLGHDVPHLIAGCCAGVPILCNRASRECNNCCNRQRGLVANGPTLAYRIIGFTHS